MSKNTNKKEKRLQQQLRVQGLQELLERIRPVRKVYETLFETPYLSLRAFNGRNRSIYYAERKGVDSVAILLTRNNGSEVLMRYQPLISRPGKWVACPVTGSMDHVGEDPKACAIREVLEETGYVIPDLTLLKKYIVGTMTNEMCYLFTADVTGLVPGKDMNTEMGEEGENDWVSLEDLKNFTYSACLIGYGLLKK